RSARQRGRDGALSAQSPRPARATADPAESRDRLRGRHRFRDHRRSDGRGARGERALKAGARTREIPRRGCAGRTLASRALLTSANRFRRGEDRANGPLPTVTLNVQTLAYPVSRHQSRSVPDLASELLKIRAVSIDLPKLPILDDVDLINGLSTIGGL